MNEIEALFVTLGMNLDDASVAKTVNEMTKAVQQKLRSSIYGDKNGAITIPATIEGTYKNGKEIEKEIKDAYAAIYNKAKEMADKGVSLTLDDIKDFRAQINKFGKLTAKKRSSDVIANVNNSLQQSVAAYRELVNNLDKQIQQQKREAAKLNKTQSNTTKKQSTADKNKKYSQKAIDGALNVWTQEMKDREFKKVQERINKRFIKGISRGTSRGRGAVPGADINLGVRSPNMDTTFLDKEGLRKNDKLGVYYGQNNLMTQMAETERLNRKFPVKRWTATLGTMDKMIEDSYKRGMAIKRQITDYKGNGEVDVRYEDSMAYRNTPKTSFTDAEKAKGIADAILPELAKELGGLQKGRPDASLERFNQLRDAVLSLNETAGIKTINNAMSVLDMSMHKWFNADGVLGVGDGTNKADETRNNIVEKALKDMVAHLGTLRDKIIQETIAIEESTEQRKRSSNSTTRRTRTSGVGENSIANRVISEIAASGKEQSQKLDTVAKTTASQNSIASKQYTQATYEDSREAKSDSAEGQKNRELIKITTENANSGFDTDYKADQAVVAFKGLKNLDHMMSPCEKILQSILTGLQSILIELQGIRTGGINTKGTTSGRSQSKGQKNTPDNTSKALSTLVYTPYFVKNQFGPDEAGRKVVPGGTFEKTKAEFKSVFDDVKPTIRLGLTEWAENLKYSNAQDKAVASKIYKAVDNGILEHAKELQKRAKREMSTSSAFVHPKGIFGPLQKSLRDLFPTSRNAKNLLGMNKTQLENIRAERVNRFGLTRGADGTGTGDKLNAQRVRDIYWGGGRKNRQLIEDFKISDGVTLDTTKITEGLQNVLEHNMFNAQTGGWLKNLIGPATLYLGQPSLEKSRAQAEGLNTVMADIRNVAQRILEDIQVKETDLRGLEKTGKAVIGSDGKLVKSQSSSEAITIAGQLEESKVALRGVLADALTANKITKSVHGNMGATIKLLGFASPELRKDNVILQNLNAGLDKTGKALKYQTRLGEILNYSFQLMARSIGQMVRNLLATLNPFSLIKKAFQDFASYDVKWQRTMNVIKYNLRAIIRPFMEWLAQQLVNILGVIDIVLMRLQKFFGMTPRSLFDQEAAAAEKMREELEEAQNITASFDELHDISGESNSTGANDLLGDIYKPQLSKEWLDFAEWLADVFEGIAKAIQWCIDNWEIFAGLLAAFVIGKALLGLLNFLGLLGGGLGTILSTLILIGGAIATIWAIIEEAKWIADYGKMTSQESMDQGDKAIGIGEIGGALLGGWAGSKVGAAAGSALGGGLAGGLAGGVIGAFIGDGIAEAAFASFNTGVSYWKGNTKETKHFSEKLGEGIGKAGGALAGAKIGAAIGTALAPGVGTAIGGALGAAVGWAVGSPLGKALGDGIGYGLEKLQDVTRGKGAFQKLKVDADEVANAYEGLREKTETYNKTLSELQEMEETSGESGRALYEEVENGTKSYWGLSDAQKAVYDKYKDLIQAESDMNEMTSTTFEKAAKLEEQEAKTSGSFKKYIATVKEGAEKGTITHDEMMDHFYQTYGSIDAKAKKVFVEQLPSYYRQAVVEQGQGYETWGNKFATLFDGVLGRAILDAKGLMIDVSEGWEKSGLFGAIGGFFQGQSNNMANYQNELRFIRATQDDLTKSTEDLTNAQNEQNQIQEEVNRLQDITGDNAESLVDKLVKGEVAYESLSSDQQMLLEKYDALQKAMATTDQVGYAHAMTLASIDLQTAETSGNYDEFIQHLIDANNRGEISAEEMNTIFAQAYARMDMSTRESVAGQMEAHGLMVEDISTKSEQYLGIFDIVYKRAGEIWTGIKESITGKVTETAEGVVTGMQGVDNTIGGIWDTIKRTAGEKWDEIKNSVVGQAVQTLWNNVVETISSLPQKLAEKWDELKTGASRGWENICTAISGWVDTIWNSIITMCDEIGNGIERLWQRTTNFLTGKGFRTNEELDSDGRRRVSIASYAVGTNYVPSDGLAYLHQGEAVIPKKYNQPFQTNGNSNRLEDAINSLTRQVEQIGNQVNQGIPVKGQFIQRGSDLVATVERANNRLSNNILNNKVYAR